MAMLMLSVNSVWAQYDIAYVKLTANDGMVSWIEINGTINGESIEIYKGMNESAIANYTRGSIDLNEVWSESGGLGTHYQVTSIGIYAFYICWGLTSVDIPSSVTSIEEDAFGYCGLFSIAIPSSVTSIGNNAFECCRNLTYIDIPSSVTSIGFGVFQNCSSLTSINIPSSVTSIDLCLFSGCSDLTSIAVESGNSVYDSRNNCNAIIETASNTLVAGCKNTKIPTNVTKIGEDAFFSCNGLTSVVIPSSVTSIGGGAFFYCSGLSSIEIPNNVTSIGQGAFSSCKSLTSITSYITDVFETGQESFYGCDNATLYVPKGLVNTYQSTADWNSIKKIEEIPGIALAMSCNNKGKVVVNGGVHFTNDMGEVSVYDGVENTFTFQPNNNCELRQVLIDGLDVTLSVENNQLTTKVHEGSKMIVVFDKSGADVNGDGQLNISDVVALVNLILAQ
jgi:hypothetical protein